MSDEQVREFVHEGQVYPIPAEAEGEIEIVRDYGGGMIVVTDGEGRKFRTFSTGEAAQGITVGKKPRRKKKATEGDEGGTETAEG
jgi:hypothetical protein